MLVESKRRHKVFVHRHEPGQIILHARDPNSFRYLIVIGFDIFIAKRKMHEFIIVEGIDAARPGLS